MKMGVLLAFVQLSQGEKIVRFGSRGGHKQENTRKLKRACVLRLLKSGRSPRQLLTATA